jgi:hypothetical protein
MAITFSQVVRSYTNARQQKELYKVLHAEGLFTGLKSAINEYYRLGESATQNEKLQCFEKMLMEIMTLITLWFRSQAPGSVRKASAQQIMPLGFKLVKYAVEKESRQAETFLLLAEELIEKESLAIDWKYFVVHFFEAEILYRSQADQKKLSREDLQRLPHPLVYLKWLSYKADKKNQVTDASFGKDVCNTLPGVLSPNKIAMLLKPGCQNYKIVVPAEHLRAFVALFRILRQNKRFRCCRNKGLYLFLQAHIEFPKGEYHVQRKDLYTLDFETRNNPLLEAEIRETLRPLLEHYIPIQ